MHANGTMCSPQNGTGLKVEGRRLVPMHAMRDSTNSMSKNKRTSTMRTKGGLNDEL